HASIVGWLPSGRGAARRRGGGYHVTSADPVVAAAKALDSTLAQVGGNPEGGRGFGGFRAGPPPPPSFVGVNENLVGQINGLENGDMAPTEAMQRAYVAGCTELKTAVTTWTTINGTALAPFNAVLTQNNLKPIAGTDPTLVVPVCSGS